ncbi:tyrosine-type recombinase/integrase, partial [Schlesneria sp.]|uniref:tyrosine-type recombinase/integrase n=1 Tax=Schlesneria sp. TaxID=2762018 RepID=UPI002F19FDC4
AKKVRGEFHFFGPWRDPQGALEEWLRVKDDLLAGRKPRAKGDPGGPTVELVTNAYLTRKEQLYLSGDISKRTFEDAVKAGKRFATEFGKTRVVSDLQPDDFAAYRVKLAKTRRAVSLGNEIQQVRSILKFAYDEGLIASSIRFGAAFKKPSAKTLRIEGARHGARDLSSEEIRTLLDAADVHLKTMILLGINAGFGNNDCATLRKAAMDLKEGWLSYARPKTGMSRRARLWPETVKAIRESLKKRPQPKSDDDADIVFITKYGNSWSKNTTGNPVSLVFRRLLNESGLHRSGIGFYSLRRTFETIAGETLDQPAVDLVMGHTPLGNDMAARYRQRISDERLEKVAEHVRKWLFAKATNVPTKKTVAKKKSPVKDKNAPAKKIKKLTRH